MSSPQDLAQKLKKIKKVFDLDPILNLQPDSDYIQKYYKINKLAYSLFHTFSDHIHMGISRDGKYKDEDLLEGARFVERYLSKLKAKNVLDLATGRGAVSSYLAQRHKDAEFFGVDISEGHLEYARKKAQKLKNYHPVQGDYHNLGVYKDEHFDIIFIFEALCHTQEKKVVLQEVERVLKPGGVFIIFDAYLRKNRNQLMGEEHTAVTLTEKSMAVSEFENYYDFKRKIKQSKFSIDYEEVQAISCRL